jgi:hypothetical protein
VAAGLVLAAAALVGAGTVVAGSRQAAQPAVAPAAWLAPVLTRPGSPVRVPREARSQPHARRRTRPRATISLYEHTTMLATLRAQGCSAARRGVGGIVILDFGQPAYNGHTYGTYLFSGRFAGNRRITQAMYGYAVGYHRCLRRGSALRISLARGTSNYHPQVPSAYRAGRKWARETMRLQHRLSAHASLARLRRGRRRRARLGSKLSSHTRLLPRLSRRAHWTHALQLRLARRRRRQHLERAAGLLRRVRDEGHTDDSRDLQPRHGPRVGRARAHRP